MLAARDLVGLRMPSSAPANAMDHEVGASAALRLPASRRLAADLPHQSVRSSVTWTARHIGRVGRALRRNPSVCLRRSLRRSPPPRGSALGRTGTHRPSLRNVLPLAGGALGRIGTRSNRPLGRLRSAGVSSSCSPMGTSLRSSRQAVSSAGPAHAASCRSSGLPGWMGVFGRTGTHPL